MSVQLRAVGMNDELTTCEKCGKDDLRGTVILATDENEEYGRFGTTCASYILGEEITRKGSATIEMVRQDKVGSAIKRARREQSQGNWAAANREVTELEKFTVLTDRERATVAQVRADSREIRRNQREELGTPA